MDKRMLDKGEYFNIYRKIFAFHKKHIGIQADEEWLMCADDLGQFNTEFERALVLSVVDELERDAKRVAGKAV